MTQSEVREQLLHDDAEFQKLSEEHASYSSQLEQLSRTPYHNAEDFQLETQLKRQKLRLKDEMEKKIAQVRRAS